MREKKNRRTRCDPERLLMLEKRNLRASRKDRHTGRRAAVEQRGSREICKPD